MQPQLPTSQESKSDVHKSEPKERQIVDVNKLQQLLEQSLYEVVIQVTRQIDPQFLSQILPHVLPKVLNEVFTQVLPSMVQQSYITEQTL